MESTETTFLFFRLFLFLSRTIFLLLQCLNDGGGRGRQRPQRPSKTKRKGYLEGLRIMLCRARHLLTKKLAYNLLNFKRIVLAFFNDVPTSFTYN